MAPGSSEAFDDLASDVEAGRQPHPTCTGEEMALHLILRRASDLYRDGDFHDQFAGIPNIVTMPTGTARWTTCSRTTMC
ncbi:hypothetical protein [Rhodococcus oryzae]|uniref:hypothetical protein n=1 Tax=Rhodococcus oryzae TaxID=2571143 RepID=UPI0037B446F1